MQTKITGKILLKSLEINGLLADGYENKFSNNEILNVLKKCPILDMEPDILLDPPMERSFSTRQSYCILATTKYVKNKEYNLALHELQDCIHDYGAGLNREISICEYVLYKSVINLFITILERDIKS